LEENVLEVRRGQEPGLAGGDDGVGAVGDLQFGEA
jgi:hypothetical protein